jgi:hypothetical protein
MVSPILDAGVNELEDQLVSVVLSIQLTLIAYICTLPFLLAILRFRLCMAGFGQTAFERIMSLISRETEISSDCGYGRLSGEVAFSIAPSTAVDQSLNPSLIPDYEDVPTSSSNCALVPPQYQDILNSWVDQEADELKLWRWI